MGFFGQVIEEDDVLEVPIPEEYYLHLTQVCVAPALLEKKKIPGPIIIYVKTANDDDEYAVAVLNPSQNLYHASVSLEFGTEDSPISLRASTGSVHVTGKWSWDEDDCCQHGEGESEEEDDECSEDDEEEEEEDESEDDEEAPMLVEIEDEVPPVAQPEPVSVNTKKQKLDAKNEKEKSNEQKSAPQVDEPKKKKVRIDAPSEPLVVADPIATTHALKPWKVYPDCDEGVPVPDPKTIKKGGGLEITDYIIGSGSAPRGGAVVKILYEGLFPNGKVFDQKLKRKSPFSFRKGTGQVIPGMDKGIEGMKIGGAREIVIPPHLGYGEKGVADIPGNQTLIFRIRLVG